MDKDGCAYLKKRPASDQVLRTLQVKKSGKWPKLFAAGSLDSSDLEGETTNQPEDAPKPQVPDGKSR